MIQYKPGYSQKSSISWLRRLFMRMRSAFPRRTYESKSSKIPYFSKVFPDTHAPWVISGDIAVAECGLPVNEARREELMGIFLLPIPPNTQFKDLIIVRWRMHEIRSSYTGYQWEHLCEK